MPIIRWREEYSVGVARFDDDHKHLVFLINEVYSGLRQQQAESLIRPVIESLIQYTREHFAREEAAMASTFYPEYQMHCLQHQMLIAQVVSLQQKLSAGQTASGEELYAFLSSWLIDHIIGVDQKYTDHMRHHGVL